MNQQSETQNQPKKEPSRVPNPHAFARPAFFPANQSNVSWGYRSHPQDGMTLRDYAAIQILAARIASGREGTWLEYIKHECELALETADAFLEARIK
jgi:hypothetical protein